MQQAYDLIQHQTQRLVMTQTLQQAIQLLQMSSLEMREYIQEAVLENPLLDWPAEKKRPASSQPSSGVGRIQDAALQAVNNGAHLYSVLHEQLRMLKISPPLVPVVAYMIDSLNDRGYLTASIDEIAKMQNMTVEQVGEALTILQSFEPTGVGARSLKECLHLQAKAKYSGESSSEVRLPLVLAIIEEGLEWLAAGKTQQLLAKMQCSRSELEAAVALIRSLNPYPGSAIASETINYIVPDLAIVPDDRQFVIVLYDHAFPMVKFNEYYRQLAKADLSAHDKDFFTKKTSQALNLLRSMEARRRTVYRVAEAIVDIQQDFFAFGDKYMKPLTMKRIAEELQLHESTISRAVSGKYAETPQGIMELKSFFTSSLSNALGENVSATSVQFMIKSWITEENPQAPFTDQELADRFLQNGIHVSRRTIAKYRDELHIPSSAARKRKSLRGI